MLFEFATATRILFGAGTIKELPLLAPSFGYRPVLVTGRAAERAEWLIDRLQPVVIHITGEPTVAAVLAGVKTAQEAGGDYVIGLGGGSVIDAAKAIAALLTNPGDPLDYLEVVGKGQPLLNPAAPIIAIPTTAGTGAEVTRNAVLSVPEHRQKVSLRSLHMLPRLAIIDPELTYSLPPEVTASTGLDALTQLIEPYVSNAANPLTDALCRAGIQQAAGALRLAYELGDKEARQGMCLASLLGGLALANAKLGAVHGLAGPLGGMFPAPHGAVCARLLPAVMQANITALQSRQPQSAALYRYAEVAQWLTGRTEATPAEGVAWVQELVTALAIPPLSSYGVTPADVPLVVEKSAQASSMKGNPLVLTAEELTAVLLQTL